MWKNFFKDLLLKNKKSYSTTSNNTGISDKKWQSVIGLEVHAQIDTKSKLFSGASTKFSSPVNHNVSLFDLATPGTLPVLNKHCVEAGILTALALNCQINPISYFDRKHYFYADLPCGYQITQQRAPLASNGYLEFYVNAFGAVEKNIYKSKVQLKQLQLEQDSGKSLHDFDKSLVDLNRAGIPLMELVFEPDLHDAEEAAALIKELIQILQKIQTCSCKMEEGALRVDANVSINKCGESLLGTRTEIKNIGSIRGVAGAINYEITRQIRILENNGLIHNETRSWDPERKITVAMRDKEVQQDYRFMPEPNLPPLHVSMGPSVKNGLINADELKNKIPELPEMTRIRLTQELGLTQLQSVVLVNDMDLFNVFEIILKKNNKKINLNASRFANFLIYDLNTVLNDFKIGIKDLKFDLKYLGETFELLENCVITRHTIADLLGELIKGNHQEPQKIVVEKNWEIINNDQELEKICQKILQDNPKAVKDYLNGKEKVFHFFMRILSKDTNKRADNKKSQQIFKKLLSEINNNNKKC